MTKLSSRLRVAETDSASDALVRLFKAAGLKDDFLSGAFAELEALSARLTTAIRQDTVSSRLDEKDTARDAAVRDLGTLIQGYTAIPVAEKKAAAQKLDAVFSKYGKKIVNETYAAESSLIESLLEDLGALEADMKTLEGVAELAAVLRKAQDEFNAANDDFVAAKGARSESATQVKKDLVALVNLKIVPYLSAVSASDAYKDFAAKVEAEIVRANNAAERRAASGKNEEDMVNNE